MTPAEAADHAEITQVLQRYGHALDEKRYELLDDVFRPGARMYYTLGGGAPTAYPEMVPQFREFMTAFSYTQHVFSVPVIELDGDRARSTCRLIATHVQVPLEGEQSAWTVYGIYRDRLERTPQGWRISEREFTGQHTEGERLPPERVKRFDAAPAAQGELS